MMNEIKFSGRGGQGVVTASQILGMAFFKDGFYPQCYSVFGGERRGAPVFSFMRVDRQKIFLKCNIKIPNQLVCFEESLFDPMRKSDLPHPGGVILVNTQSARRYWDSLVGFTVGCLDAGRISRQAGLGRIINTTILGAYCKLNGQPTLEHLLEAVSEMVPRKPEANVKAVCLAYDSVEMTHSKGIL